MVRDPYGILDEFNYIDDHDLDDWPNVTIREGMLVQPSPGYHDYNLKFEDIGLVTKSFNEKYDVLWPDGSLEKNLSTYSLERPQNRDRIDQYLKRLKDQDRRECMPIEDKNAGYIPPSVDPDGTNARYQLGDLVMIRTDLSHLVLESYDNYTTPGLIIEVTDHVVPPMYTILWTEGTLSLYEDDLELYDEH
jgi:hypothetical protein